MGSDAWPEADSDAWDQPPPVQPRRNQELEALNTRFGQLQVQTGEIQNTLNTFMQTSTQWQEQQNQRWDTLDAWMQR